LRACRLLEAAESGAGEDVSSALVVLREAAVSASAAAGALELWAERLGLEKGSLSGNV
jgi:hypothetical protein